MRALQRWLWLAMLSPAGAVFATEPEQGLFRSLPSESNIGAASSPIRWLSVTAEGPAYSEDVEMVTLPGVTGQFGVYPQHFPLITQMVAGEIIVHKDGRDKYFATGAGLIEVTGTSLAILTDLAVQNKIDEAKAEEARQRAEARLKEKLSAQEVAHINASLARSLAQLRVERWQHK